MRYVIDPRFAAEIMIREGRLQAPRDEPRIPPRYTNEDGYNDEEEKTIDLDDDHD